MQMTATVVLPLKKSLKKCASNVAVVEWGMQSVPASASQHLLVHDVFGVHALYTGGQASALRICLPCVAHDKSRDHVRQCMRMLLIVLRTRAAASTALPTLASVCPCVLSVTTALHGSQT